MFMADVSVIAGVWSGLTLLSQIQVGRILCWESFLSGFFFFFCSFFKQ
jgi:hypothetical protein